MPTLTAAQRRTAAREEYDAFLAASPSRQVLTRISDEWVTLILVALADGPLRYSDLGKIIAGVARRCSPGHSARWNGTAWSLAPSRLVSRWGGLSAHLARRKPDTDGERREIVGREAHRRDRGQPRRLRPPGDRGQARVGPADCSRNRGNPAAHRWPLGDSRKQVGRAGPAPGTRLPPALVPRHLAPSRVRVPSALGHEQRFYRRAGSPRACSGGGAGLPSRQSVGCGLRHSAEERCVTWPGASPVVAPMCPRAPGQTMEA